LVLVTGAAFAVLDASASDWYAGIAGGISTSHSSELANDLVASRQRPTDLTLPVEFNRLLTSETFSDGKKPGAWKVVIGRRLMPYLSIEASYADFGRRRFGYSGIPYLGLGPGPRHGVTDTAERRATAWGADVLGNWPLNARFDLLAGVGVTRAKAAVSFEEHSRQVVFPGPVPVGPDFVTNWDSSQSNTRARWSLGADWRLAPGWTVRLSYERIQPFGTAFVFHRPSLTNEPVTTGTGEAPQETVFVSLMRTF